MLLEAKEEENCERTEEEFDFSHSELKLASSSSSSIIDVTIRDYVYTSGADIANE
jgi:capsular polysaccharide biosynthesis protein